MPDTLPALERKQCPACGSGRRTLVETVLVAALSAAWRAHGGGPRHARLNPEASQPLEAALASDVIRMDRCDECGLELGSPTCAWREGAYEGDQDYPDRWEFRQFLEDLGPEPASILELGCGTGTFLTIARQRGHTVLGIDFNRAAVSAAGLRGLTVLPGGFENLRAYAARHDVASGFEAMAMFHVIEHIVDPSQVFEELEEFARPGTLLGISCPGPRRFTRLIREEHVGVREFWDYPPHHVARWTLPALQHFLTRRGWKIRRVAEEPLNWLGASSHVAISRAVRGGYIEHPLRRRLAIARAMLEVLLAARSTAGLSIYACAEWDGRP